MTKVFWAITWGAVVSAGVGCGSSAPRTPPLSEQDNDRVAVRNSAGQPHEETTAQAGSSDLETEGLLGTLTQDAIRRGIAGQRNRFHRCISEGAERLDVMGGQMILSFRVATDGSVRWVYPSESTMGRRDTERCLLEAAAGCRFGRPRGGEVEFDWPLEVGVPENVRPATAWDARRVEDVVTGHSRALQTCLLRLGSAAVAPGGEPVTTQVTAYVGPGGEVLSAGAASGELLPTEVLDCVSEEVSAWSLPDPGSYPAKVSFTLDLGAPE